jgi:endogenous inhibitor of DNA gyrase (YacG/DUF329 family)
MLSIDISCPHCGKAVESGKTPETRAGKYSMSGLRYLCPHCSQPIEPNNNFLGSAKSGLLIFFGTAMLGLTYLVAAKHYPKHFGIITSVFIFGLIYIGIVSRKYAPKRVRWLRPRSEL